MQTVTNNNQNLGAKSNPSYNGYELQLNPKLSKTEKKIVAVLQDDGWKLTPEQIRTKIALKYDQIEVSPGTIRPLLRNLTNRGVICNPEKGYYCDKLTYDVAVKPIAVHNIRLHCEVSGDFEHWSDTVEVGGAEIFVQFGAKRGIISGWIKYDRGLNRPACMLALDKWRQMAEAHLGRSIKEGFFLTRCEINRDAMGASFDGSLHCATLDVLKDVIVQRVYEKEDCLRQEYCVRKNMSPQQLDNLFLQGMDNFLASAAGHEQDRKLSGIEKAQKTMVGSLIDQKASIQAIQHKIINQASNEDSLSRLLLEFKDENRKTMAFMSEKYEKTLDLLVAKSVENEELKKLVLSIAQSNAKLVETITKGQGPEEIHSNEKPIGAMNEYVK